uniref:Uncharacterized protein n=1 Tax=Anguilla anguilla TaxID=7936 RepID=A0A0E9WDA7_ANGAN
MATRLLLYPLHHTLYIYKLE